MGGGRVYTIATEFDEYDGLVHIAPDEPKAAVRIEVRNDIDHVSARLTPTEARQIAAALINTANTIDGN